MNKLSILYLGLAILTREMMIQKILGCHFFRQRLLMVARRDSSESDLVFQSCVHRWMKMFFVNHYAVAMFGSQCISGLPPSLKKHVFECKDWSFIDCMMLWNNTRLNSMERQQFVIPRWIHLDSTLHRAKRRKNVQQLKKMYEQVRGHHQRWTWWIRLKNYITP